MPVYVIEWCFPAERERRLAVRSDHRAFLEQLHSRGMLVAAGPWADDTGALILLSAGSLDEVARLLEADPYLVEGVGGEHRVREWRPFIGGTVEMPEENLR
jgi:uncharacterized protein YciI